MRLKTIELPKKYEYKEGESRPEYKKYNGWNKISYSQATSFKSGEYTGQYFANYFLKIKEESGIFAAFGTYCGEYLDRKNQKIAEYLSKDCKKTLDAIEHPEDAEYEYEILIDLEPFGLKKTCLQGFTDMQYQVSENTYDVVDFKTLNLDKKKEFYEWDDYQQTNIYGYGLEELGKKVNEVYVIGLGRKGNSLEPDAKYPLRLSGIVERIDNPYDRERAILAIKDIVKICVDISDHYKTYLKYFG